MIGKGRLGIWDLRFVAVFVGWMFGGLAWADLALPVWETGEREAAVEGGWEAGDVLTDLLADEEGPFPGLEAPLIEETAGREAAVAEVPRELLDEYFAERPTARLIDPQRLFSSEEYEQRHEFLDYQAEDSAIDLVFYLFGGEQEIPGEARVEELAERLYGDGRPAVVVIYYEGAPERAAMYLSPVLTEWVSAAEQRRTLRDAALMAARHATAGEQFDAFCAQLAIRTYWIERMALVGEAVGEVAAVPNRLAERKEAPEMGLPEWVGRWAVLAGLVAAVVVLLLVGFGLRRRWGRLVLPDFGVEPRLGGAHAAGIGAVISFANAALPPSLQKDQPPDYLRRARGRGISMHD